ncbi:MAG: hypothetical protein JWO77_2757 [Ilumatobacteraceae bacterium]|nr:hypothetical protein [Ilumatobacteraceae bacterium]
MGDGDEGGDELSRGRGALDLERGWVPLAALISAVCLPILLAVLDAARAKWVPTADAATIVTRSYDMWSAHRPLVGQYSLAGGEGAEQVFSPGPFLYLVLAPAARFGPGWTLPLTMGLLAASCFGVALHAARRIGGWWFAVIVAVGLVGTVRASGAGTYVEVWNPWAGLAPFAALVMVCWLVALGRRWWLVTAVVLASFLIQTHLTYLPPSLVLLAVAVVGGWWPGNGNADDAVAVDDDDADRIRPASRGERLRPAWSAFVAALICWALPLSEQFTSSPGNLELVREAASAKDETFGPAIAVNVWWRASGLYPAFSRAAGSQISELNELRVDAGPAAYLGTAVLALALLAVGWLAIRRRSREVLVGTIIGLGLTVAALATGSRLPLDRLIVAPYSLRWIVTAGLVPWLVLALAVMRFDVLPRVAPARRIRIGAAVGAVVVVALFAVSVSRTDDAAWMIDPARIAGEDLVAATRPGDRIRLADSGRYEVVLTPALAWSLRHAGRWPVMIRNFRVGTGTVYGAQGRRCDAMVVIRRSDEPAPEGGRLVTRTAYDQPDEEQDIAVYLVDDESAHGRC